MNRDIIKRKSATSHLNLIFPYLQLSFFASFFLSIYSTSHCPHLCDLKTVTHKEKKAKNKYNIHIKESFF